MIFYIYLAFSIAVVSVLYLSVHRLRDDNQKLRAEVKRIHAWCGCGDEILNDEGMCSHCAWMARLRNEDLLDRIKEFQKNSTQT